MNDLKIVPSGTDAEVAAALKKRLIEKLTELCALCDEAKEKGFEIGFSLTPGPLGNKIIGQATIAKHY